MARILPHPVETKYRQRAEAVKPFVWAPVAMYLTSDENVWQLVQAHRPDQKYESTQADRVPQQEVRDNIRSKDFSVTDVGFKIKLRITLIVFYTTSSIFCNTII